MSGTARMNGIPYRPKDDVPSPRGLVVEENQPEPVFYDKDGIVYPRAEKPNPTTGTTEKPVVTTDEPAGYSSKYYSDKPEIPQVTNTETVSTETVTTVEPAVSYGTYPDVPVVEPKP